MKHKWYSEEYISYEKKRSTLPSLVIRCNGFSEVRFIAENSNMASGYLEADCHGTRKYEAEMLLCLPPRPSRGERRHTGSYPVDCLSSNVLPDAGLVRKICCFYVVVFIPKVRMVLR